MSEPTTPIIVSESPAPDQIKSALRVLVMSATAYAVGRGWIGHDAAGAVATLVLIGAPFVWGQIKARSSHKKLVAAAEAAPDHIAQVKRP